jgi:hypothetical protein
MSLSTPKALDPLVAQTADRIAHAINDLKRELDRRDGVWAHAHGGFELTFASHTFMLSLVPDEHGNEYPVTVHAELQTAISANGHAPLPPNRAPTHRPTPRRGSDVELVRDIVPRKKRKVDDHGGASTKRQRTDNDDDDDDDEEGEETKDMKPLIVRDDLDDLLSTLREDVQEDTSECVNHVQRLLRRFREEWHEKSHSGREQLQTPHTRAPFRNSIPNGAIPGASFPSPSIDRDDPNSSIQDVVQQEAKLVSAQIKWVEDCRRVAADLHNTREETWRTSSAGFHDRQRLDRENFQHRILHESSTQSQTLNQILNEVKAIGLYAQNLKWETPASHLTYLSPPVPTPPAFTKPSLTSTSTAPSPGGGRGRNVQQ